MAMSFWKHTKVEESRKKAGKNFWKWQQRSREFTFLLFYDVTYKEDGTIESFLPNNPHAKGKIKRVVGGRYEPDNLSVKAGCSVYQSNPGQSGSEIQRGCIRGCRFCQAGMVYRPTRPRDINMLKETARAMLKIRDMKRSP